MLSFQNLLEQAQIKAGAQAEEAAKELTKVQQDIRDLETKIAELQKRLAEKRQKEKELKTIANQAIRHAVEAAVLLGIEIPEEYLSLKTTTGNGNGQRSKGKFYWQSPGLAPFQAEVSRAMWRLSTNSGGSAGRNGEGVLTVEEFWRLVGCTPEDMALGEERTVILPNGRKISFQKIEE